MKEATWNASIVSDAVRNGDLKTLRWFFDRGCPTDLALNQNGDTALLIACRLGLLDVARLALVYNARNDPHPDYGNTALQHAVSSGHGSIVELILDCAAPSFLNEVIVNHTDANGEAPIHVASRCGSIDILTLLMMHGANVGVVDARGRTCLHLAAQQGQVACLLCVLEVGGDEFMEVRDDEGWKCLDLSIRANKMECVQVLLQTGAKVSADAIELATKKPKILKLLLEYTADTDGSIDTEEDESISLDESSRGGTIFSGLDTFIASPELKQFRTPMSTEDKIDREEEEEMDMDMDRDHQFSQNDETWTIYFTEDGYRYFYNTDRDYSTWDDPRSKRVLFGQQQTQSAKKLPPISPCVHLSSGSGHTHKEVRVKPTTIAKPFLPEKEVPPEETKITNPLEAAASDPKSILLAQIRTRRDKTASGAQIIDMVLLVVDATKGMQTQTAECLVIAEMTTRNLIVVLNKIDMFPENEREERVQLAEKRIGMGLRGTLYFRLSNTRSDVFVMLFAKRPFE
ncbi:ankyrin repeat domain-containing protein [Skeletonema marinoi]|uniref:Ankyrin repeat domain-containing protein n=1 Tax=Skeletonema marinoi TaxID=267567 RepID=A0AAD8Y3Y5_9STRA|nr:ankyrin repeat domain-containing protein [Skeletonema marinoi]